MTTTFSKVNSIIKENFYPFRQQEIKSYRIYNPTATYNEFEASNQKYLSNCPFFKIQIFQNSTNQPIGDMAVSSKFLSYLIANGVFYLNDLYIVIDRLTDDQIRVGNVLPYKFHYRVLCSF